MSRCRHLKLLNQILNQLLRIWRAGCELNRLADESLGADALGIIVDV